MKNIYKVGNLYYEKSVYEKNALEKVDTGGTGIAADDGAVCHIFRNNEFRNYLQSVQIGEFGMKIGESIFNIRKEQEMTQEEFASIFAVTRQTVSNWEKEKSYPDLHWFI